MNETRVTSYVAKLVHRLGHYLVATKDLHLHVASPARVARRDGSFGIDLFECYVDSSMGNADEGRGYAGFILMSRNPLGGALAWKCILPPNGYDSTGAAELHATTTALKDTVVVRTLQQELRMGVAPVTATTIYTDAKAVTDGSHLERFRRGTRFLAAKYAMLRWGIACRAITLERVPAIHQIADIMTKPITGAEFHALRARVLGLPQDHESHGAHALRVGVLRLLRARARDGALTRNQSHGRANGQLPQGVSAGFPARQDGSSAESTAGSPDRWDGSRR